MLYRREFQLVGVKSFRDFLSLGSVHRLNVQLCLGDDETMVCPVVRAAFFIGHSHVLSPDDDIVSEVPVIGTRGHPRRLVAGPEKEHGVVNGQAMCSAGPEQKEALTVAIPCSMVSDDSFPNLVVLTYASVELTEEMRASSSS